MCILLNSKIYSVEEIKDIVAPLALQYGLERVFLFNVWETATENIDDIKNFCKKFTDQR